MSQRLHLVYGGELEDPSGTEFRDLGEVHLVGIFADYESAYDAWKSEAQRTVDNAHMRYFIAEVHQRQETSPSDHSTDDRR